jgi:predicted metal-dependent enzyme (double-stranded beta helix superfamily)
MSVPPQLTRLADRISEAVILAPELMAQGIQAALAEATDAAVWLPNERRRASHENYARHLLHGDPQGRFSILSIVWDHGQHSPIHGHHCWCAVGIYTGTLTETHYREAAGAAAVPTGTKRRSAGTTSFDPARHGIHRIANDSSAIAISLHVYGVAPELISTKVNRLVPLSSKQ